MRRKIDRLWKSWDNAKMSDQIKNDDKLELVEIRLRVPAPLAQKLKEKSRCLGVTRNAVCCLVLHQYTERLKLAE